MPVSDTEIIDWKDDFLSDDTNTPLDSANIATLMDDEARNFKSVVRAEAENRKWVRFGHVVAYVSATSFTTPGDRRAIYIPGRRVRAVISGPDYVHGYVKSASYGSNVTTVVCTWDGLVQTSSRFTVTTDNQITADYSTFNALLAVGQVVEFGKAASDPARRLRKIASLVAGSPITVNFTTGDPWVSDLTTLAPTRISVPHSGIDNTISEVMLGQLTSVLFQSGFPGYVFGGTFTIALDGVSTSFDVPTPVNDEGDSVYLPLGYKVAITPLGVVSGTPSGMQWTRARNHYPNNGPQTFRVVLPSAESGGTVKYAYVIARTQ